MRPAFQWTSLSAAMPAPTPRRPPQAETRHVRQADCPCGCSGPSASLDATKLLDGLPLQDRLRAPDPPPVGDGSPVAFPEEAAFRHSGWSARRRHIFEQLCRLRVGRHRLDRYANCGAQCRVAYSPARDAWRLQAFYCRDRLCQPCGLARSTLIAANLCRHCHGRSTRFVTLTLRHSATPLRDQIDRLYRSLAALRRRVWFRNRVDGGVAILEVKIGADGLWHVHLHCLMEGSFLPQRELAAEWHAVTGDSFIVDVRAVGAALLEVRYVAAYAGKPLDASVCRDAGKLAEFIVAIKGRRLCHTWGSWRGLDLDAATDDGPDDWIPVAPLRDLLLDASRGDPGALSILDSLGRRRHVVEGRPAG